MVKESPDTAVTLWQELKKYLAITKKIGSPKAGEGVMNLSGTVKVVDVEVNISNTAPLNDNFPLVVFTGVGLSAKDVETDAYTTQSLREFTVKCESSKADQIQYHKKIRQEHRVMSGSNEYNFEAFPRNERYKGITLFPNEKTTFNITIPVSNIPKYKFSVEGNISFRNFLRINQPIHLDG